MNNENKRQGEKHSVESWIRIVLSFVFLLSSAFKSINIHSFVLETRLYIDAYMTDSLQPLALVAAIVVCCSEMAIALLAIKKVYCRTIAMSFFIMLSFFVYLTALNLFFPTIMGSIESCGCFGELIHFTPVASFVKSVVLWIMALALVIDNYRNNEPWNIQQLLRDKYLYISTAVSMVLPLYSLWCFNEMSHTAYIVGFVAICFSLLLIVVVSQRYYSKKIS